MRTIINRLTSSDIRGNRPGRIVVAVMDVVRNVTFALPVFGQLFQALAGYCRALKRAIKSAAAATAHAADATIDSLDSSMRGLSGCWHTQRVMPHLAVVRVGS